MAIVLIERDPFVARERGIGNKTDQQNNIRRPFQGIQVKEPRFAFISVYQDPGVGGGSLIPISLKDSSAPAGWSNANHNFYLTDVTESRQEKMQVIETFGDHYTFFYGEKPIVLQCSGMLMNTQDFNWKNEWWYNYNNFLRGTKAVEHRSRVFLGFDDVLVEGYIMNCSAQYSKDQPYLAPFSFSILLAKPPLDLTDAAAPEVPAVGMSPTVNQSDDARWEASISEDGTRTLAGGFPDDRPEYIGSVIKDERYSIDPITGISMTAEEKAARDQKRVDDRLVALSGQLLAQVAAGEAAQAVSDSRAKSARKITRAPPAENPIDYDSIEFNSLYTKYEDIALVSEAGGVGVDVTQILADGWSPPLAAGFSDTELEPAPTVYWASPLVASGTSWINRFDPSAGR